MQDHGCRLEIEEEPELGGWPVVHRVLAGLRGGQVDRWLISKIALRALPPGAVHREYNTQTHTGNSLPSLTPSFSFLPHIECFHMSIEFRPLPGK